jgi:hypothetical protein
LPAIGKILETEGNSAEEGEGEIDPKGLAGTRKREFEDLSRDIIEKLQMGFYIREKYLDSKASTKQDLTFDDLLGQLGRRELADERITSKVEELVTQAENSWDAKTVEDLLRSQLDKVSRAIRPRCAERRR